MKGSQKLFPQTIIARFDRTPCPRYYTASPMSGSGLQTYGPLVLHLLVAAILAGLIST